MSEDKQIREKIDFELEEILNIKNKNNKDIIDKIDKFLGKYKNYEEINYAIVDLIKVNPKEILHLIQKHKITLNLMPFLSLITEIKFYNRNIDNELYFKLIKKAILMLDKNISLDYNSILLIISDKKSLIVNESFDILKTIINKKHIDYKSNDFKRLILFIVGNLKLSFKYSQEKIIEYFDSLKINWNNISGIEEVIANFYINNEKEIGDYIFEKLNKEKKKAIKITDNLLYSFLYKCLKHNNLDYFLDIYNKGLIEREDIIYNREIIDLLQNNMKIELLFHLHNNNTEYDFEDEYYNLL